MPTPSIQKSRRVTRLDTKKEKEKREREDYQLEQWKKRMKERIDVCNHYDSKHMDLCYIYYDREYR